MSDDALRQPVLPECDLRLGELVFALRYEKARSMDDLILRRSRLAWRKAMTPEASDRIQASLKRYVPRARVATL
jgi:hypothetical protein